MNESFKKFIIRELRRASYRWPARSEAERNARIGPKTNVCASCGDGIYTGTKTLEKAKEALSEDVLKKHKIRKESKIYYDHIEPVENVKGWDGWDKLLKRMFCQPEGFQMLCKSCHQKKSNIENTERRKNQEKK